MEKTKKIKPMSCPICDGMYFSEPNKYNYDEEIEAYLNGEVYCRHCGWIYDLHQFENPDSHDGFNKLSLNEYKKEFKEKIKNNPNYDYFEENKPDPTPHKCPVCGEYEFDDMFSYDICPICGWEDDDYFEGGGANNMSLEEAIENFKNKRRANPKYTWEKEHNIKKK